MDPNILEEGKLYETVKDVNVCNYSNGVCSLQNDIELQEKTKLTYRGRSADDDGFIFESEDGNQYCLHLNDLDYIIIAE